jgi:hypothetical protein
MGCRTILSSLPVSRQRAGRYALPGEKTGRQYNNWDLSVKQCGSA